MSQGRLTFPKSREFTARIEKKIPGGAHTYSKGRDQFPEQSPSGIVKGAGARLWDIDGNCLIDWAMGLTSVSLGHGHPEVTEAVCTAIRDGVNFQRPALLELEAAEAFLDMVGDDMLKFARHGSCVTTAAVKLARGYTRRRKVAVAKEHPFFSFDDWFIGSTAADYGIPEEFKQFTCQFSYNDIDSLVRVFDENPDDIACVILEPVKFEAPRDDFLQKVRDLCTRRGAVLVLDEMITGLKFPLPGACSYYGVRADITTWGKGIGNGFPIAAMTGKADIMQLGGLEPEGARKLFLLSTTHGGELSGIAAMKKTVEIFRRGGIVEENWRKGQDLRERLDAVTRNHGLEGQLRISGYPGLMLLENFDAQGKPDLALRTLFMQEMIAYGVLFQGLFVLTPSHGEAELAETVVAWEHACAAYRRAIDQGSTEGLLVGPVIKPVFRKFL